MAKRSHLRSVSAALACSLFGLVGTGCGSMFTGTTQSVSLVNLPPHSQVFVDGSPVGDVAEVTLPKDNAHTVQIQAPGYQPQTVALNKEIQGVYWVNLFNGIGFVIDLGTGGAYRLTPETIDGASLTRQADPAVATNQ